MAIVNPNSGFQIAFQQNFLARFFEEGLDSEMAFRRDALQELLPIGAGQSITKTRVGRTPPQPTALNPLNVTGLDNGLTPSLPPLEQYVYNVNEYGGSKSVDLLAEQAGIADQLMMMAKLNGVEAAQTVERVAKRTWFASYNTGNTWIRDDGSASDPTESTIYVDDIRGFQFAPVNGQMEPVSAQNPLLVNEIAFQGGVTQSFYITAAVADAVTQSVYPSSVVGSPSDGVSGYLTISPSAGSGPVAGDAIISSLATPVIRPNNKQGTNQLTQSDQLTLQLLNNAKAVLKQNAVPVHPDNSYHVYYDYQSEQELLVDQQFQIASASRVYDEMDQNGAIFTLMGMKFIPTTEVYLQASNTTAGMQALPPGTSVHRVLITGAGGLCQGNFAGLESYAQRGPAVDSVSNIFLVDNIAHIIRAPLDNMGRQVSLVYLAVFGMVCPTDLTTTPAIIPTCNNSTFKRAIVIEHC